MRLLPHAGDWLHRPSQFAERNNRLVSRISSDQVRPQEATKPHLCHIHAIDKGVGGFVAGPENPRSDWSQLAAAFTGKFKTPTLRNVDKRPRPDFVKAYMHNGYLKSLKEVVHFYNTRDSLPRCAPHDAGEKRTCWPPPEYPDTMNKKQLGDLRLTEEQEDQIVAFLQALTDGFVLPLQ